MQTTRKKNAPYKMMRGSATVDATRMVVYVIPRDSTKVLRYNIDNDKWDKLPDCPYRDCGLVFIKKKLITVGGRSDLHPTNQLSIFE